MENREIERRQKRIELSERKYKQSLYHNKLNTPRMMPRFG